MKDAVVGIGSEVLTDVLLEVNICRPWTSLEVGWGQVSRFCVGSEVVKCVEFCAGREVAPGVRVEVNKYKPWYSGLEMRWCQVCQG